MLLRRSKICLVVGMLATLFLIVNLRVSENQSKAKLQISASAAIYASRSSAPTNETYRALATTEAVESALGFTLTAGGSHLECAADGFSTDRNVTAENSQTVLPKEADAGGMNDQSAERHANSLFHDFLSNTSTSCSSNYPAKNSGSGKSLCLVILLRNDFDSVPVQTLMSAIEFTSGEILKEVVFVFSIYDISVSWLQAFYKIVSIYKNSFILCNIRAKSRFAAIKEGILYSKSQYVAVLEDNVVLAHDWLEPLLSTLERKPNSIAVPQMHQLTRGMINNKGKPLWFKSATVAMSWRVSWGLQYRKHYLSLLDAATLDEVLSVIQGDIIVFSKEFAQYIVLQMRTETIIELSFLAWMCGDGMQMVGCSRVYKANYNAMVPPVYSQMERDALADTYMTNYTALYRAGSNQPELFDKKPSSDNVQVHDDNCKNFEWYARNIAGLPLLDLPPSEASQIDHVGQLMNDDGHTCFTLDKTNAMTEHGSCSADGSVLHTTHDGTLRLGTSCLATNSKLFTVMAQCNVSETMAYRLTASRLITNGEKCLAAQVKSRGNRALVPVSCPESDRKVGANLLWSLV